MISKRNTLIAVTSLLIQNHQLKVPPQKAAKIVANVILEAEDYVNKDFQDDIAVKH
jgi:hypothetical protein